MKYLMFFLVSILGLSNANAVTFTWTGAADSLWSNASNWSGGVGYPNSATDDVRINNRTIDDFIVLTEDITVDEVDYKEKRTRGILLNGFDLTVEGTFTMFSNTVLKMEKSDGQLILNDDFNMASGAKGTFYDINQTTGTFFIQELAIVNILNPTTRVDITLNDIIMSDKATLFFKNTKNVTLADIDVADFCVIEFPRSKTTTFTSVVNWDEVDCATFNTFRSFKPGIQAKLKFTGGASSGDFNAYEDISIITSGGGSTFTADNRTNLGNNTGISGTTAAATSCSFDGNGDNVGNWEDATEWDCGCVPRSIDDVTIDADKTVTIDGVYAQCDDLTFGASTARISGANSELLEIHGSLTTVDEDNFSEFLGKTEFRNDIIGTTETLECSGCDTVKFYGVVLLEFPGNTWQASDHISVTDPNDSRRGDLFMEQGTLDMNDFDLSFESDLDVNDELVTGTGEVRAINQENSTIRIDGTADFFDLVIDKSTAGLLVTIRTNVYVTNSLDLNGLGIVTIENTDRDTLILSDNATVLGGSTDCHVNPSMMKIGNDDFTYPLGNGTFYRPIGLSDMAGNSIVTDQLYAEYFLANPFDNGMTWGAWDPAVTYVSTEEYWDIDNVLGTPTPKIVLSWLSPTPSGGIADISDLLVTHWDGATFENLGNGSTTGNTAQGTITSNDNVTSFSPFVMGSSDVGTTLPVELLYFTATFVNSVTQLEWVTSSEINNDKFLIERSTRGGEFQEIGELKGAGNSQKRLEYLFTDVAVPYGDVYYRLRQVDFDGTQSLSNVEVIMNYSNSEEIMVYPNPYTNSGPISITGISDRFKYGRAVLKSANGRHLLAKRIGAMENNSIRLSALDLQSGVYYLQLVGEFDTYTTKLIVR